MGTLAGRAAHVAVGTLLSLFVIWGAAHAAVPQRINYQGYLTNAASQPVTATVTMVFRLYNASAGTTPIYTETQSVQVVSGVYSVAIGSVTPLTLPFDVPYYLGVTVGTDAEMTPRQAVLSSPYALRAGALDATAVLPATQISGTLSTSQLADGSVTKEKLGPSGCASGQILKLSGSVWTCAADATGGSAGGVTSVTAGTGLTGGTITTTGTIAADTAYLQRRVTGTCAAGSSMRTINADGSVVCEVDDGAAVGSAFVQGGNAFGAVAVLGTTDNQPLDIRVNGRRAMRFVPNATSPNLVGGHAANSVDASFNGQTVAGGGRASIDCWNPQTNDFTANCRNATGNHYATVGGGIANVAQGDASTVAGGSGNTASGLSNTVGGGSSNTASGFWSTVAGGTGNTAGGDGSTVGGGYRNNAGGQDSFAAGSNNVIGPGGRASVALGHRAEAPNGGCFVFGDRSTDNPVGCYAGPNAFVARATGGFWMLTGGTDTSNYTGAHLASGSGSWTVWSDRNGKDNLAAVAPRDVLAKLVALPIATWNWKTQRETIRHMGPMAQDFHAAFGLGESETGISTVDAQGVALAAIQGLNAKLEERLTEKDARIAAQQRELDAQRAELASLRERLANVESLRGDLAALRQALAELRETRSSLAVADPTVP